MALNNRVKNAWQLYCDDWLPVNIDASLVQAIKRAFYEGAGSAAGALLMFALQEKSIDSIVDEFEAMLHEVNLFRADAASIAKNNRLKK